MSRHLVANLEWEHELARAATPQHAELAPLPARVLATITTAAALLRVLLDDDDTLWTPAPLDPTCLPEIAQLARPRLGTGSGDARRRLPRRRDVTALLAWGENPAIAALRPAPASADTPPSHGTGIRARLWRCAVSPAQVAARSQHRAHTLEIAHALGHVLPGAACVHDPATLRRTLPRGPWVLKVPWSSAGRERVRGTGADLDAATLARIEKLLARHGELFLEPWRERVEDLGVAGLIEDTGVHLFGVHRQHVDADGRFLAIEVAPSWPSSTDHESLLATAQAVGERLAAAGQRGPFGIDAWRERAPDGRLSLHPLGEVNARMTFGHVAHAYREWADLPALELAVSSRRPPPAPGQDRVPLVLDPAGQPAAWLVPGSAASSGVV